MFSLKRLHLFITALFITALFGGQFLSAQAPNLKWSKIFGGGKDDRYFGLQQTQDSGFVVTGWTFSDSINGNHTLNGGNADLVLMKLDSNGKVVWQFAYGGSKDDNGRAVRQTADGGYIIIGSTTSEDGDVKGLHSSDSSDIWVVKTNGAGVLQWSKTYGSIANEAGYDIKQTSDGGYVFVGTTQSGTNGDVSGGHGSTDGWVVKLNDTGAVQWQKALGGAGFDATTGLTLTSDGGCVVIGYTNSGDGDIQGLHGSANGNLDVLAAKFNASGAIQWQKCLGGTGWDVGSTAIEQYDGSIVVVAYAGSVNGDVTGYHNAPNTSDLWVATLNASGVLQSQICVGGNDNDIGQSIYATSDSGYVVSGYTRSNDGDLANGVHKATNGYDAWILKFNKLGVMEWQKCIGGSKDDFGYAIGGSLRKGLAIAGISASSDGDVPENRGSLDMWVIRFVGVPEKPTIGVHDNNTSNAQFSVYPNPGTGRFFISVPELTGKNVQLQIFDDMGRAVYQTTTLITDYTSVDLSGKPSGLYTVVINSERTMFRSMVQVVR